METYEVVVLSDAQSDIENIANYIVENYKNESIYNLLFHRRRE